MAENIASETNEKQSLEFVTITVSKKQVIFDNPYHNETNGKDYVKVLVPNHGVLFYPAESLHISKQNENEIYFKRPIGTELQVVYSERIAGVPDEAPANEKYKSVTESVKIEDLKARYDAEMKAFAAAHNDNMVTVAISEKLTQNFSSKKGDQLVSVSVPVYNSASGKDEFYKIVLKPWQVKNTEQEGRVAISLYKNNRDGEPYEMMAQKSYKDSTGEWQQDVIVMTSEEIAEAYSASKIRYKSQNEESDRNVGDWLNESANQTQGGKEEMPGFRRSGR